MDTRTLIKNEHQRSDRSSRNEEVVVNDDGSTDIWFGPEAPQGKEGNWIPTIPDRAWFAYLRLYEPLEPYFAREWPLPDIELVK